MTLLQLAYLVLFTFSPTHSIHLQHQQHHKSSPDHPWRGTSGNVEMLSSTVPKIDDTSNEMEQSSAIAYLISQHGRDAPCAEGDADCQEYKHAMRKIHSHQEYTVRSITGSLYVDDRDKHFGRPLPIVAVEDREVRTTWSPPPPEVHHVFRLSPPSADAVEAEEGAKAEEVKKENDEDDENDENDENDERKPSSWCVETSASDLKGRWWCDPKTGRLALHETLCTPFIVAPVAEGLYTLQQDPSTTSNPLQAATRTLGEEVTTPG
jgi:hypothetical protein